MNFHDLIQRGLVSNGVEIYAASDVRAEQLRNG